MFKHPHPPIDFTFEVLPADGNFSEAESWIPGWLETSGHVTPQDIRVRIGENIFLGLLNHVGKTTSLRMPFAFLICPESENCWLQIDVWLPPWGWTEVLRRSIKASASVIRPAPPGRWLDRLPRFARNIVDHPPLIFSKSAQQAIEGAMARPLNVLPSPPFFGRLETPTDDGFVRHGKLLISGWLTHVNKPILGLTARANGVPSDTKLTYGLQRRDVHREFPDHPNSGYSHFLGLIDFPSTAADPAIILIFADVGEDVAPLVFAQRFIPWNRSVAVSSQKRLSFPESMGCAASLVLAHWRHSKGKTNRADLRALLKIPSAALVARRAAASAPFAESTPLSLFASSLADHELLKPDAPEIHFSPSPSGLNLLFVLHCDFSCASALHVLALTQELSRLGHSCVAAVPDGPDTLTDHESVACKAILHADILHGIIFPNGKGPDVIHAWTARERVRRPTELALKKHPRAILIVHLEDNEESVLNAVTSRPIENLISLTETEFDRFVSHDVWHPREGPRFVAGAAGVTLIIATLAALVPKHIPTCVITPSADRRYFHPQSPFDGLRELVAGGNETILFYHGNVHASNASEVRELYVAILALNRSGLPTRLIRTGYNEIDFLGELTTEVAPFVHDLGKIRHHRHLAPLMALADMFVQPGEDNEFNAFRFPSKLPEFFSFGRPVIIPRTNLGLMVRHGVDAFVLEKAHSEEIADTVQLLRSDTQLYRRLSEGAIAFSERYFSWRRSAEGLAAFYETLVSKKTATPQ